MLGKLAVRNVKRQFRSYMIYFMTVVITVALIFAVNNTIFSSQLLDKASNFSELKSGLIAISVIISLIVAFVLGYASSFILKLRKREFGTYLTLGMTRTNLLTIFVLETLVMFAIALVLGIVVGLLLFQLLMALIMRLMEMEIAFAAYSLKGLLFTICLVVGIFFLSSVASALYLKKVKIYDLIHSEKKVDKDVKRPFLWLVLALASLAVLITAILLFNHEMNLIASNKGTGMILMLYMLMIAVSIIFLHIGAAKSIVALLLKNKKICADGTNTFTLRQLNSKLKSNSVMVGFLAFLIAFAVIGANLSFVQKATMNSNLERQAPFDINVNLYTDNEYGFGFDEAEEIINEYTSIEKKIPYTLFNGKDNYLHSFTIYSGEMYESLLDTFIKESDFNALMKQLGKDTVSLKNEFIILKSLISISGDFSSAKLEMNGQKLNYRTSIANIPQFAHNAYFVAVVPDAALSGYDVYANCKAYDIKKGNFDSVGLEEALSYDYDAGSVIYRRCDYRIRENIRISLNANNAIFVISALYIAIVFVFMAMALLALKTLSETEDDKRKYSVLFRLGASKSLQSKTLFAQIFSFFIMPFSVPVLLGIPTAVISYKMLLMGGLSGQAPLVALISGLIIAAISVIYLLYFTATYFIAKKSVVHGEDT